MLSKLVVLVILAQCALGYDQEALRNTPAKLHDFDLPRWLGHWFLQARLPPCSWAASNEFSDFEQHLSMDKQSVLSSETWRNDACVKDVNTRLKVNGPGCFDVKDPFGNVMSGSMNIPATDYKKYSISWGCTKMSGGKCDHGHAFVSVKTRQVHPHPKTWKLIDQALHNLWGMKITELNRVKHENSCSPNKPHVPGPRSFKMY